MCFSLGLSESDESTSSSPPEDAWVTADSALAGGYHTGLNTCSTLSTCLFSFHSARLTENHLLRAPPPSYTHSRNRCVLITATWIPRVFLGPVRNLTSINRVKCFENRTPVSYFKTAFLTNSTNRWSVMSDADTWSDVIWSCPIPGTWYRDSQGFPRWSRYYVICCLSIKIIHHGYL